MARSYLHSLRVLLLTLCALVVVLVLGACASVALASSQRGHVFVGSFGGSGEGALSDPGDVAVSDITGDVYVLDRGHNRIVQYGPGGEFVSAWGWGVQNGAWEYQVCTSGCQEGVAGRGEYQFNAYVMGIAVDNCTKKDGEACSVEEDPSVGDVYVLKEYAPGEHPNQHKLTEEELELKVAEEASGQHAYSELAAIDKLSPSGERLHKTGTIRYQEGGLEKELELECEEGTGARGLTVGLDGTVWLYYEGELFNGEGELFALSDRNASLAQAPLRFELGQEREPGRGVAVDGSGDFYTGYVGRSRLPVRERAPARIERGGVAKWQPAPGGAGLVEGSFGVGGEETSGVAVNERDVPGAEVDEEGDVFVASAEGVTQVSAQGQVLGRFGGEALHGSAGVAVDSVTGGVYVADPVSGRVDVFGLEGQGAPRVDGVSVLEVRSSSAKVEAQVAPADRASSYAVRYIPGSGPVPGAGESCTGSCVQVPAPEGQLAAEWGDVSVSVALGGAGAPLGVGTTYSYRVIARNSLGVGEREGSFATAPEVVRTPSGGGVAPADGRVWEAVSPPDKGGAQVGAINEEHGGLIQAAPDGSAITYVTDAPIGEAQGNRGFEATQMLATRGAGGWSSQDLVTPSEHASSVGLNIPPEYQIFSEDLSLALVKPFVPVELGEDAQLGDLAEPPLSPPLSAREEETGPGKGQQRTVYVHADTPVTPTQTSESGIYEQARTNGKEMERIARAAGRTVENTGYVALISDENTLPGAQFGAQGAVDVVGANPSLSTVVLLLQGGVAGLQTSLYEWREGGLSPVAVLPCEEGGGACASEPVVGAQLGDADKDLRHAVSDDGSRVFWSGTQGPSEGHLYMRASATPAGDPQRDETIQLDRAQDDVSEPAMGDAVFQSANAEGTRVFFTDTQPLTAGAGAGVAGGVPLADLYECEIVENAQHRLECKLSDLTSARGGEESADVQGTILGTSEDGSVVYFVADGVLGDNTNANGERAVPGSCAHTNGQETPLEGKETCSLYLERYDTQAGSWEEPVFIATLSHQDSPDWESSFDAGTIAELDNITARVSPDGRYLAFMSDRALTSFYGKPYDNRASAQGAEEAAAEEVYEYTAAAPSYDQQAGHAQPGVLVCASCDPSGQRPVGAFEPNSHGAGGGEALLVDRTENWKNRWLAGIVPGWTRAGLQLYPFSLHQSRYLSNSGRLYFDSPEKLLPGLGNGQEYVYEYEPSGTPQGAHACTDRSEAYSERAQGCIGLISSPTASGETAFLDASETGGEGPGGEQLQEGGGDVFFLSSAKLVPQEQEETYSLYDAHECTNASPCIISPEEKEPVACQTTDACRSYTPSNATLGAPVSAATGAVGNASPHSGVLPSQVKHQAIPKLLTRAQKLTKALETCRAQYKKHKHERVRCEKRARARYAPPAHAKKKKKKTGKDKGKGGTR